jgi:hypothetical protein
MAEPRRIVNVRSMQPLRSWPDAHIEEKIMRRVPIASPASNGRRDPRPVVRLVAG